MNAPACPPEPPVDMPPARTVWVRGHGEMFLRDTGGEGPPVMLLHGWMASADLNWWAAYDAVRDAGYRVLAIDHRGHGRGLRPLTPFRLIDCAADAAAALRALGATPALVVGYSMGGAIAQLVARDHPDVVRGLVLSGTAQHWQDPRTRRAFKTMGALGLTLSVAPRTSWRAGLRQLGLPPGAHSAWVQSELMRQSARDMAEAGRELARFDSRPWLGGVASPIAVVLTSRDELVPPSKQLALAQAVDATVFEAPIKHLEVGWLPQDYNPPLLKALEAVGERQAAQAA